MPKIKAEKIQSLPILASSHSNNQPNLLKADFDHRSVCDCGKVTPQGAVECADCVDYWELAEWKLVDRGLIARFNRPAK